MIAPRLVRLVEDNAVRLAAESRRRLLADPRFGDLGKVPGDELERTALEIYGHLGEWLLSRPPADAERLFLALGARRAAQRVALSQALAAVLDLEEHLWQFLREEVLPERPMDLFEELELLRLVDRFFDRAVCHVARGYEEAGPARAA